MNTSRLWVFSILFTLGVMASACGPGAIEPTITLNPTGTAPLVGSSSPTVARTPVAQPTASATVEPTRPVETPSEFTAPLQETQVQLPFAMDWSPAGEWIAVTSGEGLHLMQTELGQQRRLIDTEEPLEHVSFSPDGEQIAASDNGVSVYIWETLTANLITRQDGFMNGVYGLTFDRFGRLLIASHLGPSDSIAIFGLLDEGNPAGMGINGVEHGDPIAISPHGNRVAVYSLAMDRMQIFGDSSDPLVEFDTPTPFDMAYSPDGNVIAAVQADCLVRLWDPISGELEKSLSWCEDPEGTRGTLAFSRDGRLLAVADGQGTLLVWDLDREQIHRVIQLAPGRILGLAFGPSGGKLASLHEEGLLQIWKIEN